MIFKNLIILLVLALCPSDTDAAKEERSNCISKDTPCDETTFGDAPYVVKYRISFKKDSISHYSFTTDLSATWDPYLNRFNFYVQNRPDNVLKFLSERLLL